MGKDLELVSICVITYNSSGTVLDTLNSIWEQTYPRLELIVSDDCSSDNTVEVCEKWLELKGGRFENTKLLVGTKNGGVARNLNSAVGATRGQYVKPIAGDDLLLPNCISDNMEFINNHENQGVVFSNIQLFYNDDNGNRVLMDYYMPNPSVKKYYSLSAEEQYKCLLKSCFTPAVPVFYRRSVIIEHPFSEQYRYCEDWPQWIHLTKEGIKLSYFDNVTALYRTGDSLTRPCKDNFINPNFHQTLMAFFYAERYPILRISDPEIATQQQKEFFLGEVAIVLLKNRRNLFTRALLYVFKMMVGTRHIA